MAAHRLYPHPRMGGPLSRGHRRQRRPLYPVRRWPVSIAAIAILVAVVALVWYRPPAASVAPMEAAQDRRLCQVIETVLALAGEGVPPPQNPTPAEVQATQRMNAELAQRRETIMGLDMVRELDCGR